MIARLILSLLVILAGTPLLAQELQCNVSVVSSKIQGSKTIYTTMQTAINEFMNSRVWTNHVFDVEERIECNIQINITEELSTDEFKGEIQIQSRRPVYNSSYNTVLFNYKDNDVQFRYVEFETLEFNPTLHLSNLTSLLAFYAYIIIGLDYDTYSPSGGTPYFQIAEGIVLNAQSAPEKGWKAFQSSSRRNRYWLANNLLDDKYREVRSFYYQYHRMGLDMLDAKLPEGRSNIAESLKLLQNVYRTKPDPYMQYLKLVYDAKSDEFVNVFGGSYPDEKSRIIAILVEIDPANSKKYEDINKASAPL